jgi:hypothetical protein
MRAAAIVMAGLCGCSWLFQTPLKTKKAGGYDGTSEPRCDDGSGLAIIDLIFGGLSFAAALETSDAALTANVLTGLLFTGSMLSGFSWAHECEDAYSDWRERRAERNRERQREQIEEEREVVRRQRERLKPVDVHDIDLRGFFCTGSPAQQTVSACARRRSDCESAKGALAVAVPDVSDCFLVESAWCFDAGSGHADERCAATEGSCNAQRATAGNETGECIEQR